MHTWSAMRKKLETEYLAESLRGRLQYYAVTYRKSHDREGRIALRLDGSEILQSSYFVRWSARCEAERKLRDAGETEHIWARSWEEALESGEFDQHDFYRAFAEFDSQPIAESLSAENALVRMLALLDRRTGKRTLEKLRTQIAADQPWLQMIYCLRLAAECIPIPEEFT